MADKTSDRLKRPFRDRGTGDEEQIIRGVTHTDLPAETLSLLLSASAAERCFNGNKLGSLHLLIGDVRTS